MGKMLYNVQDYRKKRVIIDTDAACEADDPFAIAHALMSSMLEVKGICAEHFVLPGSMERSFEMVNKVIDVMGVSVPVFRGQSGKMAEYPDETISEAAQFIANEALAKNDMPLYLLCIGAITNVARAIKEYPEIAQKVTIVWIGGNAMDCKNPDREFNFGNDVDAVNIVLQSGADIWLIPNNVYGTMHMGFAEIQKKVYPYGEIGKFLYENLVSFYSSENASWSAGESWSLGDSPAVGVTLEPNCGSFIEHRAPFVKDDITYEFLENNPLIRVYTSINSRFIIEDFVSKLQILYS